MTWDNAVLISRKTAVELGVKNSDVVEIKLANRSVRGPIWIQPGFADYSLGLALGYGRHWRGLGGSGTGLVSDPLRSGGDEKLVLVSTRSQARQTLHQSCT